MLKKFLHGLAFGAGFAVALIVVTYAVSWGMLSYRMAGLSEEGVVLGEVGKPPRIAPARRFLGSTVRYTSDFDRSNETLVAGDGKIVGNVRRDEQPLSGVTLRLALNGSVWSQWATTDAAGAYTVAVPFGRYRIDGYELQSDSAQRELVGKIDSPRNAISSREFEVSQDNAGGGLTLRYVDPVIVLGPTGDVTSSTAVVLSWEPYAGAARYTVQLYGSEGAHDGSGGDAVFKWSERPQVAETFIDLTAAGVTLKPGSYYTIEVYAADADGRQLSQTYRDWQGTDFRFVAASTVRE